jgi:small-conductance mechanosensitive channel
MIETSLVKSYILYFIDKPSYIKIFFSFSIFSVIFIFGHIFEKHILVRISKIAGKSSLKSDTIIIDSLKGSTLFWLSLLGLFLASFFFPIKNTYILLFQKILIISWILSVTHFISKLCIGFINSYSKKNKAKYKSASILRIITSISIFIIGFMIVIQTLGVSIAPLLTTLGVGGLAVALALQDTLSNLFSGIHIIASKQINTGDYIKLDTGEEGYVVDISWRNMSIRELSNNIIIVPNGKVAKTILRNYDLPKQELSLLIPIGVSYSSDLEHVEKITIEVATDVLKTVKGGVPDFEPFIRYHTFGESSIIFNVFLRAKEFSDHFLVKHEFIIKLHKRYKEENIEIPFPIRSIYMKEHNSSAKS